MTNMHFFIGAGVAFFLLLLGIIFIVRQNTSVSSDFASKDAEDPNDPETQMKLGYALAARAGTSKLAFRRVQGYREAAERFRRATELAPSLATAWTALGQTLYLLFRLENNESLTALANANAAYESAVRLSPANASLWQHWGEDLYMAAAYCKEEAKKEELASLAKACYARAVALNPDLMEDWRRWGGSPTALEEMQAATGEEAEGDMLLTPGARSMPEQAGGSMPWALEADMADADKFFSETPASVQQPPSAPSPPSAEAVTEAAAEPQPQPERAKVE